MEPEAVDVLEPGGSVRLSVTVEVAPGTPQGNYRTGIALRVDDREVNTADITLEVEEIRELSFLPDPLKFGSLREFDLFLVNTGSTPLEGANLLLGDVRKADDGSVGPWSVELTPTSTPTSSFGFPSRRPTNDELRAPFESFGLEEVDTYLASGNVVFRHTGGDLPGLEKGLEAHLEEELGFVTDTFVRALDELAPLPGLELVAEAQDEGFKLHVIFLKGEPGDEVKKSLGLRLTNASNSSSDAEGAVNQEPGPGGEKRLPDPKVGKDQRGRSSRRRISTRTRLSMWTRKETCSPSRSSTPARGPISGTSRWKASPRKTSPPCPHPSSLAIIRRPAVEHGSPIP